jgi:hypothetical protein
VIALPTAADTPPALERPAIVAPAPREISFGTVSGRVGPGTTGVSVSVDGRWVGAAAVSERHFRLTIRLPPRDVTVRVTAVDAQGRRASASVAPVFGLPRAAVPRAFVTAEDPLLGRRVRRLVETFPGIAAVVVEDLRTGRAAAWNARARFPAASTLKLGIALELLRVGRGPPAPGSWLDRRLREMLVDSDNAAANELEIALGGSLSRGAAQVTTTLRRLGLAETLMSGGYALGTAAGRRPLPLRVESQPAFVGKYTSAWDLGRLHRWLHLATAGRGPLVRLPGSFTPADARFLLYILAHVRDTGKLDRYVAGQGAKVLHKAGWITNARHDSGIVYWRRGAFVAVVMTWSSYPVGPSSDVLAGRIAEAALRRFSEPTLQPQSAEARVFHL